MVRKTNGKCARVPGRFVGNAHSRALVILLCPLAVAGAATQTCHLLVNTALMTTALPTDFPRDPRQSSIALAIVACVILGVGACTYEPEAAKPASTSLPTPRGEPATAPEAAAQTIPGDFDYWLIALSWSPTWCEFNPDNREQCGTRGFGFVLHGLWPQDQRGSGPQNCGSRQRVSERTIDRSMGFMPSRGLIIHEWRSHGSCTTLDPDDYFQLADRAFASVRVPQSLRAPRTPPQLSARDISSAFVDANPGLSSDAIQVACNGNRLSEVRICADADLSARTCGKLSRSRCPGGILRIPSVR